MVLLRIKLFVHSVISTQLFGVLCMISSCTQLNAVRTQETAQALQGYSEEMPSVSMLLTGDPVSQDAKIATIMKQIIPTVLGNEEQAGFSSADCVIIKLLQTVLDMQNGNTSKELLTRYDQLHSRAQVDPRLKRVAPLATLIRLQLKYREESMNGGVAFRAPDGATLLKQRMARCGGGSL